MNCPRCGLEIEEQNASFCPHCGERLDIYSTKFSAERATFPAQPIHQAPTRISANLPPEGRRGWASSEGPSPATPATNAAFYSSGNPAHQPPPDATFRRSAALPETATPRRANSGRIILGILILQKRARKPPNL